MTIPEFFKSTKGKRVVLILSAVFLVLAALYVSSPRRINYDDMYAPPEVIEEDGVLRFYFPLTDGAGTWYGGFFQPMIYDYENGIRYSCKYISIAVSRFDQWFHKAMTVDPYFEIYPDGREPRLGPLDRDLAADQQ